MKKDPTLTLEDIFSELEGDLRGLGGNRFQEERLPRDVDAWQLAERWDLDVSSARRTAKHLVSTGKWQWIRVRDPRCPQGLMVLRKAENGQKAESSSGGNHKRK